MNILCMNTTARPQLVYRYSRYTPPPCVNLSILLQPERSEARLGHRVHSRNWSEDQKLVMIIKSPSSHLLYPLTAGVVGAPQMTSQPVSFIFSVLHCPLGLCELQAYPFPDVVFQPLFSVCLAFFLLSLCLAGWFWPDLTNGTHVHTTSVCVSER